ncbi:O-antigen ligase family protein [Acinetobacter sp. AC1-2]|uniref:O-antigen ligase family protein n=1 Tax=Acinetobacter sp. AC1-2 TaxID=2735132 RepID=UPI0018E0DBF2|nr:O-antigen ligase family protein [Acinetobacter sp. AC1-2]MBI1449726.1 O-antigen ligase family protein [Acinetobacter sp. AC1-2]
MSKDDILINLASFGLVSSLVFPFFSFFGFGLYLTSFISLILLFCILFYNVKIGWFTILVFLLCLVVFVSSLYSNAFGFSVYNFSNYLEAFKYFQYIPYIMIFHSVNKYISFDLFLKYIYFSVFIYLLVFFLQLINPLNLGYLVSIFYLGGASSPHLLGIETGFRLPITGSNPNVGAVIGVFFTLFFLILFAYRKNKAALIIFICCFISVFYTQSRTTLVALIVSLVFYAFLSKIRLIYKILVPIFLGVGVFLIFKYLDLSYIVNGYEYAKEGDNSSVNARLDTLDMAINVFYTSPIFGVGPSKEEYTTNFDSEYILILMRYGVLGCLVFSSLIFYLLIKGFKNRNNVAGLTLFLYTIATLIIMLTNNAYSGYQLMSITVLLYIIIYCDAKQKVKL